MSSRKTFFKKYIDEALIQQSQLSLFLVHQLLLVVMKSLSNSFCYTDQSFFDTYLITAEEAKQNNIRRGCQGKDVKELYQVIDEDKIPSFSNPDIYNVLHASQKELAEKKYKKLTSLAKKIDEAEDESEVKRLGRVYREEAKEFQKEFFVPLIKELGKLVELKESVDDEKKKKVSKRRLF